ncbi:hypothetical protein [Shewanella nanhaiensis]|uniref:Uncharacterized protein n=1 Tax=Shewanella nanhaiensis TaxID=2864872 RepID=A0ABS7E3V9_9GAMM|nr:hypothetical protein [Shewanella nanhaiensis]MBW8184279.1 hypothetical protein [Shewanella nanhaiensis]
MVCSKYILIILLSVVGCAVQAGNNTLYIFNRSLPLTEGIEIRPIFPKKNISAVRGDMPNGDIAFEVSNYGTACNGELNEIYSKRYNLDDETVLYEKKFTVRINEELVVNSFVLTDCNISIQFFGDDSLLKKWLLILEDRE